MKAFFVQGAFLFVLSVGCLPLHAQSFHTVNFTGNASTDFGYMELRGSNFSHTNYYVTYDQTFLYIAAEQTSGDIFADFDHFTMYLDTDPQLDPTTGSGSTMGVTWDGNTPALPFRADYRVCMRYANSGESFFSSYSGGAWTTGGANAQGWLQAQSQNRFLEVRIPRSDLGNPLALYFVTDM
jgi:hypothetical protein